MMPEIVYALCAIMSVAVTFLLVRSYLRTKSRLVFWSSICFALLAINNLMLFADFVLIPNIDIGGSYYRVLSSALAGVVLLFGLIREMT